MLLQEPNNCASDAAAAVAVVARHVPLIQSRRKGKKCLSEEVKILPDPIHGFAALPVWDRYNFYFNIGLQFGI